MLTVHSLWNIEAQEEKKRLRMGVLFCFVSVFLFGFFFVISSFPNKLMGQQANPV